MDVQALVGRREELLDRLAEDQVERLQARYDSLAEAAGRGLSGEAMAARALRNACLSWLTRLDPMAALAQAQFDGARGMTEKLGALRSLVHFDAPGAEPALHAFRTAFADDPLVTDKWITLVATRPHPDACDAVAALMQSPWWIPTNPNRVRAVLGAYSRSNPLGFHRLDGAGYRRVAGQVAARVRQRVVN